jgi:glycosyltransferase involved in cell wall biosynthesis
VTLRLGFVSGRAAWQAPDGVIWTDAGLGRLIDALGARAASLECAVCLAPARHTLYDHRLAVPAARMHWLPYMASTMQGLARDRPCRQAIHSVEAASDVAVIQLPFSTPSALLPGRRPRVYHVCADVQAVVEESTSYRGLARIPAVALARVIFATQRHLARRPRAATVTNGQALFDRLRPRRGHSIVSSALHASEIASVRRRRPADAPLRILFVGYLRPEKGIDELFTAFGDFLEHHPGAELRVVGARPPTERGTESLLHARLEDLRARGTVELVGARGFGPELFTEYADADLVVVPSHSEGTPRVLVEARAFSCPVVATSVGGIPSSVEDGVDGLLVPPRDARALAAAMLRIFADAPLRRRLVEAGLERARIMTVDALADALLTQANSL